MTSPHDAPAFARPTSPSDVPDVPLRALVNVQLNHAEMVRTYAANRDEHALTALVYATAIVDRLETTRWALVEAALQSGASLDQIAAAAGVFVEVLRVGYAQVLDDRVVSGRVTPAERDTLLQLIDDGPR